LYSPISSIIYPLPPTENLEDTDPNKKTSCQKNKYLGGYIIHIYLGGDMNYTINLLQQLGPVLKGIRKKSGMTQKQVAEKVGMLPKTISALETGSPGSTLDRAS